MNYQLEVEDRVILTTQEGDVYNAIVLEIGTNDLYIKMSGFGKLTLKWSDIRLIQKLVSPVNRGTSYSPAYKVKVWQSDIGSVAAS
jgi:hypothetical protein